MSGAKTAGERVREIFLNGGRDLPSCFAVHDYLDAIPADAPKQIAALKADLAAARKLAERWKAACGGAVDARDAARGDAEALAVALKAHGLGPCAFRPFDPRVDVCKTCDQQDTCVALAAHEESR